MTRLFFRDTAGHIPYSSRKVEHSFQDTACSPVAVMDIAGMPGTKRGEERTPCTAIFADIKDCVKETVVTGFYILPLYGEERALGRFFQDPVSNKDTPGQTEASADRRSDACRYLY
jgi:hypothetical protein